VDTVLISSLLELIVWLCIACISALLILVIYVQKYGAEPLILVVLEHQCWSNKYDCDIPLNVTWIIPYKCMLKAST
jgi:hypothetical protein